MDEDEYLFRASWEDEKEPLADRCPARAGRLPEQVAEALLIPLARTQHAVARLEASVAASAPDVAAGLRARLALFEAAGCLAHHGPALHPHDLALRDAGLTGSYAVAAMTGRLRQATPWTTAEGEDNAVADDHLVAQALAYARHWRRLAELATVQPLKSVETLAAPLSQLGAHPADDEATRAWLNGLPGPAERPGLLAAAAVVVSGLPGMPREDRLDLAPAYVAAALWRRHGYGRSVALPFWSAPVSRINALGRRMGGEFDRGYLDASPRRRSAARGNLGGCRTRPAGSRRCLGTARSQLREAGVLAIREPLVTGHLLAGKLDVSSRGALNLIDRLIDAGVLREMTGRAAWRAFAVA